MYAKQYGWTPRAAVKAAAERQISTKQDLIEAVFNASAGSPPAELARIYAAAERLGELGLLNFLSPETLHKARAAHSKR